MTMTEPLPSGTVIATATPDLVGWFIRLRSKLMHQPSLHNHIALFTHYDNTGRPRGLEGRPSGFGWANLDKYLNRADTLTNAGQPLDPGQRELIVERATSMIGIPYDWASILAFAAGTAGAPFALRDWPTDGLPSHVVCSNAIAYVYRSVGAAHPGGLDRIRGVDPDDWTAWVQRRGWQK